MRKIVVIPARLNSTRLPHKVLLDLHGKTVIRRVYEQCLKATSIDEVYIATDSVRVMESCRAFTDNIIMTDDTHDSGTDRIAEAIRDIECDIVINVQGDEPAIEPSLIDKLASVLELDAQVVMASVLHKIQRVDELKSSHTVKVTIDRDSNALYFSRSIIPHHRDGWDMLLNHHTVIPEPLIFYKHLGIYGYTKEFLLKLSSMESSYLERVERLEQLRVLESGYKIKMIETEHDSIGIDTEDDYAKALELLR